MAFDDLSLDLDSMLESIQDENRNTLWKHNSPRSPCKLLLPKPDTLTAQDLIGKSQTWFDSQPKPVLLDCIRELVRALQIKSDVVVHCSEPKSSPRGRLETPEDYLPDIVAMRVRLRKAILRDMKWKGVCTEENGARFTTGAVTCRELIFRLVFNTPHKTQIKLDAATLRAALDGDLEKDLRGGVARLKDGFVQVRFKKLFGGSDVGEVTITGRYRCEL